MSDSSCAFCRIAARDIPADVVHETDLVVGFRDLNPRAPVHLLLIPKEHIASVADIEERHGSLMVDLMRSATHLAEAEGIAQGGWRLVSNVGDDGGQTVFHMHFHLLGGRRMTWPPG